MGEHHEQCCEHAATGIYMNMTQVCSVATTCMNTYIKPMVEQCMALDAEG